MGRRVGDELIELSGVDHAAGDERRDALDRREEDEADALGFASFEGALGLALFDQLEHDCEDAVGGLVERSRLLAVLTREHRSSSSASRVAKQT
jgi:hypothetical protein